MQIIRHVSYNSTTFDNDIALLRLNTPLTFNTNVQGTRYATANDATNGLINPGILGLISGWGWTNNLGLRPDNLQSALLPIISNQQAVDRGSDVTNNMIALEQSGIGAAPGDSGGPMVVNGNVLAGVSSWGHFPKDQNPTIYTRVSNYCDWISDRIAAIEDGGDVACSTNTPFNLRHHPFGSTVTWAASPASYFVTG
ncbi:MAG: serine protease [Cyclobacteriaceae bacterium]